VKGEMAIITTSLCTILSNEKQKGELLNGVEEKVYKLLGVNKCGLRAAQNWSTSNQKRKRERKKKLSSY
jgi:hypothetical protein